MPKLGYALDFYEIYFSTDSHHNIPFSLRRCVCLYACVFFSRRSFRSLSIVCLRFYCHIYFDSGTKQISLKEEWSGAITKYGDG